MGNKFSKSVIAISCATAALLFQNCSSDSFSANSAASKDQTSTGVPSNTGNNGPTIPPPATSNYPGMTSTQLQSICSSHANFGQTVADGSTITNFIGIDFVHAHDIKLVQDQLGILVVFGESEGDTTSQASSGSVLTSAQTGAQVEAIDQFASLTIICGADVGSLSHGVGIIVVVGGNVGNVDDFFGDLVIVGGSVTGTVTNSLGLVVTTK